MSFGERWREIRTGFERSFWVANFTELFERLAYYGLQAVLAIYLHERLGLSEAETGSIQGIFGFVVWFLPILGGAIADRFGVRWPPRTRSWQRVTSCSRRSAESGWRRLALLCRSTGWFWSS